MAEQSLKEKTAKGLFWGGLSNGVQQLLNLFFGIFLSRILNAEDYGMVGMLSIFSLIAGSLQESGFTAALAKCLSLPHFVPLRPTHCRILSYSRTDSFGTIHFPRFLCSQFGYCPQCLPVPQLNGQAKGNGGHYRINCLRNYRYNYGLLGICLLGHSHTKHCLCRNY